MSTTERQRARLIAEAEATPSAPNSGPRPEAVAAMKRNEGVAPYSGEPHFEGYYGLEAITDAVRSGELDVSPAATANEDVINQAQAFRLVEMVNDGLLTPNQEAAAVQKLKAFEAANPGQLAQHLVEWKSQREPGAPDIDAEAFDGPWALKGADIGEIEKADPRKAVAGIYTHPAALPGIMWDTAKAIPDLIKTVGGSAAAEVGGGALGATHLLLTSAWDVVSDPFNMSTDKFKQRMDESANLINAVTSGIGFVVQPWTDSGRGALEAVAGPLMELDAAARDVALEKAGGDPEKAAMWYTVLVGSPELLGFGAVRGLKPQNLIKANVAKIKTLADEMGIKLNETEMVASVVEAAKTRRTTRAENAGELRDALVAARRDSRIKRSQAATNAQKTYAAIDAGDLVEFGKSMDLQLRAAGYSIDEMAAVRSVLDDFINIDTVSPLFGKREGGAAAKALEAAEGSKLILPDNLTRNLSKEAATEAAAKAAGLDEIWAIRNKITKSMVNDKRVRDLPDGVNPNKALGIIDRYLDEFLDHQYATDMISGDPAAIAAWRYADDVRVHHNRRFHEDKFIEKLMDLEADPTEIRAALVGMSATAPKQQAVRTIKKIKEILGPDHPAIRGIGLDYTHELVKPLLHARGPNFSKFIDDFDELVTNNYNLVQELGLDVNGLRELRNFADTARKLNPTAPFFTPEFLASAVARFAFGHGIAKAGLRVNIWRNILSKISGVDRVSQKQIIQEAAGIQYGTPVFSKGSEFAYSVLRNSVLADLKDEQRRIEKRRGTTNLQEAQRIQGMK